MIFPVWLFPTESSTHTDDWLIFKGKTQHSWFKEACGDNKYIPIEGESLAY